VKEILSIYSAANAFAGACEYILKRRTGRHIDLSRLFIYYNGQMIDQRSLDVTDDGASKQNTILGMRKFGICEEHLWPYKEELLNKEPTPDVYEAASNWTVIPLKLPRNLVAMKTCLANQVPFLIGIRLLDSATSEVKKNNGYVSMPNPSSLIVAMTGSHAVLIVGYDDRTGHFLARNSWGKDWVGERDNPQKHRNQCYSFSSFRVSMDTSTFRTSI
jgi:C1A family cysteine protease